ncbi:hypothetical protein GCM10010406_15010 [Streptomyces thermolineatus]|uniref:Uncharacterized protein n=1 Tax=Streptomyces thermolineatus TaxID=44033 RepID=A0ABN3L8R2_9ACTN
MTTQQSSAHVGVHLVGCTQQDADAVFDTLEAAFPLPLDPHTHGTPVARPDPERPTVWSMSFDVRFPGRAATPPERLDCPVVVDLFGSKPPVDRVREALAQVFSVEDLGSVPGDQEMEARLRLSPLRRER